MAYHKNIIPKGELGQPSKITEEYFEFMDAVQQNNKVLILCELSDIMGAIEHYLENKFNSSVKLEDLIAMHKMTRKAFKDGER